MTTMIIRVYVVIHTHTHTGTQSLFRTAQVEELRENKWYEFENKSMEYDYSLKKKSITINIS
jgi:hypothetical protein